MRYLFGDSTISPFTSNVLEFLRDAIDFSVYVLEADQRIRVGRAHMDTLRREADADVDELENFARAVATTIETTPKRSPGSPAIQCAERMIVSCKDAVRSSVDAVRERLANDIAQAEAGEAAERDGCLKALTTLLGPHEPPGSATVLSLRLREAGGYDASLVGECAGLGLTWKFDLDFPEGHLFAQPVRIDRLVPNIELNAPELTGWLKKEVKTRPQRIEHHTITEVVAEGSKLTLHVRAEPNGRTGFDLEADLAAGGVRASRVVGGEDQSAGPFEVVEADVSKILELCKSVETSLAELTRLRLAEAKVGDTDFRAVDTFVEIVERIIGRLAPVVHDVATHSLESDELVLRRQLANNRREEIFVLRSTLREKYQRLEPDLRLLFAPLALETALSRSMAPPKPAAPAERSELTPSRPPPAPSKPTTPFAPPPPKAPTFPSSPPAASADVEDLSDAAVASPSVEPPPPVLDARGR